jgi:hypothetical protein
MIVLLACIAVLLMIVAAFSVGLLLERQDAGAPDDDPWFARPPRHAPGPRDLRFDRPGG